MEGSLLQETSSLDRKATATNQMHSNDLEACGIKCCNFWLHSEVKSLTRFDVFLDLVILPYFNRLFKAVRVGEPSETRYRPFLKVKFANKGIDALNLSNIATCGIRHLSKVKSLHIFNTRSRHAFLIAIPVRLLPKCSTTKQVCSK